jgi:hypothetical protein
MKMSVLLLSGVLLLSACGNKVDHSNEARAISSVQAMLDNGKYDSAISSLEALRLQYPNSEEIKTKLLHAYAGAGSFEAIKVIDIWKEIQANLKELKEEKKNAGIKEMVARLETIVEPIPELTVAQKKRLNQAIDLYAELGMDVETAGKYNNFKWGTLHVYRLAVTVKALVAEVKVATQTENGKVDTKAIETAVIPKIKTMGQDIFMAYKLFSNSFDKIKKITDSVDKLIAKTVNDETFKLKINTLAKNEEDFYSSMINDNISAVSVLVKKAGEMYRENDYQFRIDNIKNALPSEVELKDSEQRILALVRVFIEQMNSKHPEIESKLKSIFNTNLKEQILKAAELSIKAKNTEPLKVLLDSKQPEIEVLKSYYLVLKDELDESNLGDGVKQEVELLKMKVNKEVLKAELKEIGLLLNSDGRVLGAGVESILLKDKASLEERQKAISGEIKELDQYLGDLVKGVDDSLKAENPDKEVMEDIIEETKVLVES